METTLKNQLRGGGGHTPLDSPTDTIRVSEEVEDFNLLNFKEIKNRHKPKNKKRKKYKQYKQSNKSQVKGGSL